MKRIVVSIYFDPDFYPPTINAILNLSAECEELVVITRNNSKMDFPFPSNVKLVKVGAFMAVRDTELKPVLYKLKSFSMFMKEFLFYARSSKTQLIVLFDPIPLFAYHVCCNLIGKKKMVWYHNHDMPNKQMLRKFSVGWFAAKYEHKAMEKVHLFSLPSNDRLEFYPLWKRKADYYCIPNYPSLKVYTQTGIKSISADKIKIIFQGFIGSGHALEELIDLSAQPVSGMQLNIVLKGSVKDDYRYVLDKRAAENNVSEKLTWVGIGPYSELPKLTKSCHIGIAIHKNTDIVSKTLGTASNKIYEYAASGLPVILYDSEQFRKYLDKYEWAFFCDGSQQGLKQNIENIVTNFQQLSQSARHAFEEELNFEKHYTAVLEKVKKIISSSEQ